MLTIEIKINGNLIKYIQAINIGCCPDPVKSDKEIINHYKVHYHDFNKHEVTFFKVNHIPNKGVIKLVKNLLKKIKE